MVLRNAPPSLFLSLSPSLQHDFLSVVSNAEEMISQLIQRTQKAVEELDNQNYRHQKMLLSGAGLDEEIRDDDIESEPPRYIHSAHIHTCMCTFCYAHVLDTLFARTLMHS